MGGARTGEGGWHRIEGAAKKKNPGGNHPDLAPTNVWLKNLTQILKNATPTLLKKIWLCPLRLVTTPKQSHLLLGLGQETI